MLLLLLVFLVLLDAFVIPRPWTPVGPAGPAASAMAAGIAAVPFGPGTAAPVISDSTYEDSNIRIRIETIRRHETDIHIADVRISKLQYLRSAFAKGTFGRNFRDATSKMAAANRAILAINGDYYGVRDHGFVLRNGILYRKLARPFGLDEALAIDSLGEFTFISERQADAVQLTADGAWQIYTFGPALVVNGQPAANVQSKAARAMPVNPRAAIGIVEPLHYVFIVSDGRLPTSAGLSLLELAQVFIGQGCSAAYNLDGGGSATLWFNGRIVNRPTDGLSWRERSVSDIVYIGYP